MSDQTSFKKSKSNIETTLDEADDAVALFPDEHRGAGEVECFTDAGHGTVIAHHAGLCNGEGVPACRLLVCRPPRASARRPFPGPPAVPRPRRAAT